MKLIQKTILFALASALMLASLPPVSVSAASQNDISTPPQGQISNERLEKIWAHQLRLYNRLGQADQWIDRIQKLIDRAKAKGKDVSPVQSALDAFETAAREAHPIFESMKGLVNSHQGFDENGKVTDPLKAQETIKAMREKFQEIKTTMNGAGQVLRAAIRAFLDSNPRPTPSP